MSVQDAPAPAVAEEPVEEPVAAEPAGTVRGASARSLWRRFRVVLLVLGIVLLVATAIGVAQSRGQGGRLDPRSADPSGGRALAALLDDRGVRVDRVTDPATVAAGLGSREVALVAIPGQLDEAAARTLGATEQGTVVLLSPSSEVLTGVTDDVTRDGSNPVETRQPGCDAEAAVAAGGAYTGGATYRTEDGDSCYRADDDESAPLVTGTTRGGADLVVLGTGATLTNDRLDEDGNAALALNLLGADGSADRVRWLIAAPGSDAEDESTASILPDWVLPALLQLLLAGALLALWRGRRLGPPVVEPLPVVVRAAEAVEGRARLYRRAQARDRATESLRAGALARMVPRLGIDVPTGAEPPPGAVVAAVAARSGRPDAAVHATLFGPPPVDDAGLVALADTLDSIVRDTLDPEGPQQ